MTHRAKKYKATAKFNRLNALHIMRDSDNKIEKLDAAATLRRSSDVWTRRNNTNVTGFWRP
jgi:hypothetical protein